ALALAAENVDDYELGARVHLVQGDLFAGLSRQRFDLILCNPPYVNARSMAALPAEFRAEPQAALAGGEDGMDLVARILATAHAHLQHEGRLVLDSGHESRHFERRFPRLEWAWVGVAQGENRIVAVDAGALREAAGAQDGPRRRR